MAMRVRVSSAIVQQITNAARDSPHVEICGLLFGGTDIITEARPCLNIAQSPARSFEIDPGALIAAHRAMRAGGPRLIGCYHSHPDGIARPSRRDAASAAADSWLWLIATGEVLTCWRAQEGGTVEGRFEPLALEVAPAARVGQKGDNQPARRYGVTMAVNSVDFASLLCSRLCHDLLSPVGALNNGLELLADEHDPEMRVRCIELLGESARASANKLKFFRLAFGAAGGFGETVDTREARTAIEGLFSDNKRLEVGWLVDEAIMPKSAVKVMLNLALIAGDALVRGGQLDIGGETHDDGSVEIVVRAAGTRIVLDAELRTALTGGIADASLTPRAAAAHLVHAVAIETGGMIQISEPDSDVLLFGAMLKATG